MGAVTINCFDTFEQQILEIIAELKALNSSEQHMKDALRTECSRAETAEAARDAALRAASEARADAAAAATGATHASGALAKLQEEFNTTKVQLDIAERQRSLFEEKFAELSSQLNAAERELLQLRNLKATQVVLRRQYMELEQRVRASADETQIEVSRLEQELRRVERSAAAGTELRERARLAAASHTRERRLADAELRHTSLELLSANAEIARLTIALTEAQRQNTSIQNNMKSNLEESAQNELVAELRSCLEAERSGAARLEKALATALADNAALAATLAASDADSADNKLPLSPELLPCVTKNSALDSFLAD